MQIIPSTRTDHTDWPSTSVGRLSRRCHQFANDARRSRVFSEISLIVALGVLLLGNHGPINAQGRDGFIWGVNGHIGSGSYGEDLGIPLSQQVQLIKNAGFGWYRTDVFCDPANDEFDRIMPVLNAAGINVYANLNPDDLRPFDTLHTRMTMQEVYDATYNYTYQVANKWKGQVKVWDMFNEPDGWTLHYGSGRSLGDYNLTYIETAAALLKGQSDAIRAADPNARISMNATNLSTGFVDHMINHGVDFDILSWHWYDNMGPIENSDGVDMLQVLLDYGKSLWIGESNSRPYRIDPTEARTAHGDAWLSDFQRTMYNHRFEGAEAHFTFELLDSIHLPPSSTEREYGIVKMYTGADDHYYIDAPADIYYRIQSTIAGSKRAAPISEEPPVFADEFDGGPGFDFTKWTTITNGTTPTTFTVDSGLAKIVTSDHNGAPPTDAYLKSAKIDLSDADAWTVAVRFRVNTSNDVISMGPPTGAGPCRQVQLVTGIGEGGGVRDFAVSLLENPSDPLLFSLGWGNWWSSEDEDAVALLDDDVVNLTQGRFYSLLLHHRPDGNVDFYLDDIFYGTRPGFGGVPDYLLLGDLSSITGVNLDIDYVRVMAVPAPEPSTAILMLMGLFGLLVRSRLKWKR